MEMKTKTETVIDLLVQFASDIDDWFTMAAFTEMSGLERGDGIGYTAANTLIKNGVLKKQRRVVGKRGLITHYRYCKKPQLQQKPLPKMSPKPQMKRQVAVSKLWKESRLVDFYASEEVAAEFGEFGIFETVEGRSHRLTVDPRYDFAEVAAWVVEYDERLKA